MLPSPFEVLLFQTYTAEIEKKNLHRLPSPFGVLLFQTVKEIEDEPVAERCRPLSGFYSSKQ